LIYLFSIVSSLLSVLLSIGNGIILARLFEPSERGLIAQYMYIATFSSTAALMLFVPQAITKTVIASGLGNSAKPLTMIIGVQGAFSVAVVLIYVFLVARSPIETGAWILIGIYASINILYHGLSAMHRGLGNANLVSSTQPTGVFLINILLLVGLVVPFTVLSVVGIYVFVYAALVALLLLRLGHDTGQREVITPSKIDRKEVLALSSVELVLFLYSFADKFVLSEFFSLHAFGLFALASSMASVLFVLQASLSPILFMQLAKNSSDTKPYKVYAEAVVKLHYLHLSLFAGAIILAVGGYIITPLLFGKAYAEASVILPILVSGYYCRSLSMVLDTGIRAAGHARVSAIIYIAGFVMFGCLTFGMRMFSSVDVNLIVPVAIAAAMATEFLFFCLHYSIHTNYSLFSLILVDTKSGVVAIRRLVLQSRMLLQRK
jgi:O-antigen/teichoic acid export membrane protein